MATSPFVNRFPTTAGADPQAAGNSALMQGAMDAFKLYMAMDAQNYKRGRQGVADGMAMDKHNAAMNALSVAENEKAQVKQVLEQGGGLFRDNYTGQGTTQQYIPDMSNENMQRMIMQSGAITGDATAPIKAAALNKETVTPKRLTQTVHKGNNIYQDQFSVDGGKTWENNGASVDKTPASTASKSVYDMEKDVRTEFNKNSKDYRLAKVAYDKIVSTDESGAGDMSMIFAYMKTLDPTSTVREGEFATAENTGGIPTKIFNMYNKAIDGQFLTPDQRNSFRKQASLNLQASKKQYDQFYNTAQTLIKNYGLNTDNVFGSGYVNVDNGVYVDKPYSPKPKPKPEESKGIVAAPANAVNMLKQDPTLADQFKAKYGYLPEGF